MNFATAIERVLGAEGGYVSPEEAEARGDPGGETNWGISKHSYPDLDIRSLSRLEAIAIYQRDFWDKAQLDRMSNAVKFQALDFAVNSGIPNAARALQRVAGVAPDGIIGPITLVALREVTDHDAICLLLAERLEFMTGLSNWPQSSRSWARRVAKDLRYGAEDA